MVQQQCNIFTICMRDSSKHLQRMQGSTAQAQKVQLALSLAHIPCHTVDFADCFSVIYAGT